MISDSFVIGIFAVALLVAFSYGTGLAIQRVIDNAFAKFSPKLQQKIAQANSTLIVHLPVHTSAHRSPEEYALMNVIASAEVALGNLYLNTSVARLRQCDLLSLDDSISDLRSLNCVQENLNSLAISHFFEGKALTPT